jgi:hypothetical protein
MHSEWLAFEHNRIHVMEQWPDGPRKDAGIASARCALESLAHMLPEGCSFECATCRLAAMTVIPNVHRPPSDLRM